MCKSRSGLSARHRRETRFGARAEPLSSGVRSRRHGWLRPPRRSVPERCWCHAGCGACGGALQAGVRRRQHVWLRQPRHAVRRWRGCDAGRHASGRSLSALVHGEGGGRLPRSRAPACDGLRCGSERFERRRAVRAGMRWPGDRRVRRARGALRGRPRRAAGLPACRGAVSRSVRRPAWRGLRPTRGDVRQGCRRVAPARTSHRVPQASLRVRLHRRMRKAKGGLMATGEPLLAVEHLTKKYGNVVALNDVSFSITSGITGILGENGAGKSTAIKILFGLPQPTSGSATVLGQNACESVAVRARGDYMPETAGLDPAGREEMLALIRKTHRDFGISVLFSSHLMADIERTCDRIIVLQDGRLVQSGEVDQFTKETETVFIEVDSNRDGLVAALERRGVGVTIDRGGLTIEGPDESVYDHVRDALVEAEAPLRRMAPRRRALSELFERDDATIETGEAA